MYQTEFMRPLVSGWLNKIELAIRSRSHWQEIADECMMFFSKSAAAMWDPKYQKKFWKGVPAPRFRVTINKAFEMVAIFGPNLMWDVPHRKVESKRILEIPIEIFGDPNDPQVQQFYQQVMMESHRDTIKDRLVAHLMETWLNYTSREIPGGGLDGQSYLAITDALIKGRGVQWVKPYQFPASGRVLTGAFREPPENLLIDPDYTSLDDAKWISIRRISPTWEVERRFRLPSGSLSNRSSLESAWAQGEFRSLGAGDYLTRKDAGQTNDMMVYYEIWSKTGPGTRLTGMNSPIKDHMEEVVGDYAWIVVSPNVPYPLNCPKSVLDDGATDSEVKERFMWPVPTWMDDRWPIEVLDFYPDPESSWPVAPLAPAMGELKFMNVMLPHLMNRIWSSSRDFWAVMQPAYNDFVKYLREGADQTVIPVNPAMGSRVGDMVQVLQQPQTNMDVWRILDAVSQMFDKRTGLVDFMYGTNTQGTQDRTAETTLQRKNAAGIRPKAMAKQVLKWQNRIAALEAFNSRLFVSGNDVEPLLGSVGARLWDGVVRSMDVEAVARQMSYTVAASSMRFPNKDRDIANINQMLSIWLPIASQAAQASHNYDSVNQMLKLWAEAADQNIEGVDITPPQPDAMVQQMQQMQMQLEQQKLQLEAKKMEMDIAGKQLDMQSRVQQSQLESSGKQFDLRQKALSALLDQQAKRKDAELDQARAVQEIKQDQQEHMLDMLQREQEFRQKMNQERQLNELKLAMAKAK